MGVEKDLDSIGELIFNPKICLVVEQLNHGISEGRSLLVDGSQHIASHHHWIMVEESDQDVDPCRPHGRVRVRDSKGDDIEKAITDEVGEQVGAGGSLQILRDSSALVEKVYGVFSSFAFWALHIKDGKELLEKGGVTLEMLNDVNLVEEDDGVEDRKGRVVQDSGQDDIFQILKPPGVSDLLLDDLVPDRDDFLVSGSIVEVESMTCFVGGEIWVIFQSADDSGDDVVGDQMLDDGIIVQ